MVLKLGWKNEGLEEEVLERYGEWVALAGATASYIPLVIIICLLVIKVLDYLLIGDFVMHPILLAAHQVILESKCLSLSPLLL